MENSSTSGATIEEAQISARKRGRIRQRASASLEMNRVMGTLTTSPEIKKNNLILRFNLKGCNRKAAPRIFC